MEFLGLIMKTYNKLFEKISSLDNLLLAFNKAKKGKSKKSYVISFEENLEANLEQLRLELLNRTYQPRPLKKFIIRDPKTRIIHASIFRDRIIHHAIINILSRKIKDEETIWLIRSILNNFESKEQGKGLPLGNYTSQFFANVYLHELDGFVKHELKAKFYIRYVDDFVILHSNKKRLEYFLKRIKEFLPKLKIELHPDKTEIYALRNGITFLGYRIFYHYTLLRKRNIRYFIRKLEGYLELYNNQFLSKKALEEKLNGWFGYSKWANTYIFRNKILQRFPDYNFSLFYNENQGLNKAN